MKQPLKSINFAGPALGGCYVEGFADADGQGLVLTGETGVCITRGVDTGDSDAGFNRLTLSGSFAAARLEVLVAAADEPQVWDGRRRVELDRILADPDVSAEKKEQLLRALPCVRRVDAPDLLLHGLSGRWAWVLVRAVRQTPGDVRLARMRLEFPRCSFSEYFPEIYQQDEFFDRFLAVFQSLYLDAERLVDEVPSKLDYETAGADQLRELAGWVGASGGALLDTARLRRLIRDLDLYQGKKGTREALARVVELVTGLHPRIVEQFQWNSYPLSDRQRSLNGRLYGETENDFCVILDLTNQPGGLPVDEQALNGLIDEYSPLGTRHKLVLLRRCSYLDTHCYLDVNSCLSVPQSAQSDTAALGSYVTLG